MKDNKGMTLIEVVFVVGILVFAIAGLLVGYINCIALNEHDRRFTEAMNIARELIEQQYRRRTIFDTMCPGGANNCVISIPIGDAGSPAPGTMRYDYGFSGSAYTEITGITGQENTVREVKVVICWIEKNGRIVGEDDGEGGGTALDGALNGSEDADGDGALSSPCTLTTVLTRR